VKIPADAIIITSDEPYTQMRHTQLIYAEFLSIHNKVIYVAPPVKWNLKNLFSWQPKITIEEKNLSIFSYINILPSLAKSFRHFNEWYNQLLIKKLLQKENAKSVLLWHFDSFRGKFNEKIFTRTFATKRIYHVIDPYFNNPINELLSEISDLIIITSPKHNLHYKKYVHKSINIPQGVDIEKCELLIDGTNGKFKENKPYTVLLGTISDDIDFDTLLDYTKDENTKLVVIGKISNLILSKNIWETLLTRKNVMYLGVLAPADFYPILKNAIAGLILYNAKRRENAFSPLKALNYLMAGIPVISNSDCEIPDLIGNGIFMINNGDVQEKILKSATNFDVASVQRYLQRVSLQNAVQNIVNKVYHLQ